jgi:elongation factor G
MKDILSENLRNVAVVGHGNSGKTSLVSALLYNTKMVNRLGKVEQGNTVTDFDEEEIARKISIQASLAYAFQDKIKINILDTPGFANFVWESMVALQVVETGVMVVSAQDGVQVQTERIFDRMGALAKPMIFVVNKMSKELVDFDQVMESMVATFGKNVIAVQYPIGQGPDFRGLVDIIEMKAYEFGADDKGESKEIPIPDALKEEIGLRREALLEKIAENDEKLMEKYFAAGALSPEELRAGLKNALLQRNILPVLVSDALANQGVKQLLEFIVAFAPSPTEAPPALDKSGSPVPAGKDAPFSGLVFKTISDPFTGKVSFIRVFSGTFKPDTFYYNSSKDVEERVASLFLMQGKTQEAAGEVQAGDIVAVAKLKETQTGDTLSTKADKILLPEIVFPVPSITFAIEPKARGDEGKISNALQRIMEEDPTIRMLRDPQTKEMVISGNGQLHVELVVNKLKRKYGVEVAMKPPKIAYRETILGKADVEKKHKKQSGGRGQYGHVLIRMEPLPRGGDYEFVNALTGMSIPRNFVPAIEKGILEAKNTGVLAGYPVVDFKIELYDGSHHEVDSSDMAFKIASSKAFKMAMKAAKPTILEPVMSVEVVIPEEFMGEINGNLSGRRGKIQGMETQGKNHVVKALVPMSEMLDFEPTLTSITGGRGSYVMEFSNYEEVPAHLQKKIIDEAVKEGRIKEEEE